MKQIRIGFTLFTCIILLLQCNLVKAINILPQENVTFYGNETYREIYYQGEMLEIPIAVCRHSNGSFPAYALSKEKHIVDETCAFYSSTANILQNDKIRNILMYGYPNDSYQTLNCSNEEEAYLVMQLAIWNEYYHYDFNDFTVTDENRYPNIFENLQNFLQKLQNINTTKPKPNLSISEVDKEWINENENKQSKTYQVLADMNFGKYEIEIESYQKSYIKVLNEANEPQKTFSAGEKFKIIVPNNLDINFKITAIANFETIPVKFGNGYEDYWESYLFLGETETIQTSLLQSSIHKPIEQVTPEEPKEPINPEEPKEPGKDPENQENENQGNNNEESNENKENNDEVNNKQEEESNENNKETEDLENKTNELDKPSKNPNQEQTEKEEINENLGTDQGEKEKPKPQETMKPVKPNDVESNEKKEIKQQEKNAPSNKEENNKSENLNQANKAETSNITEKNNDHNKNQNSKTENLKKSNSNSNKQNKKLPRTGC